MSRSLLACALLTLCSCGSGTEGRIVNVRLAVQPEAEPDRSLGEFASDSGWEVTFERAELALVAIYAFAPEREPSVMARARQLVTSVAYAHGGHDPLSGKRVRAELAEPLRIDLLAEDLRDLGAVEAEAGTIASLAVDLASPSSEVTGELGGHQVWVSGVALRGDERVRFEGGLRIPDQGLTRRVETKVDGLELDDGDTLVLGIRPSAWLREADFGRLEPGADDEPRVITLESQVGRAWFVGARSPAAFSLRSIPKEVAHDRP